MKRELELYVHIPFCIKKCDYCDFLSGPADEAARECYLRALEQEIRCCRELQQGTYEISSVFFGGGTPSVLKGGQLSGILEELRKYADFREDAEITAECNPGTVSPEKLRQYREAGINRLSFGLQSADNRELRLLGRIHTWEAFCESYAWAREAGFANINVDLMSALPGQTLDSWKKTLNRVLALKPEHISAYSLIIEEGTPFYDRYGGEDGGALLPDEDTERQMYYETGRILGEAGYKRYEISNYARPGFSCRHNEGYWKRTEYRGFGLGAASLIGRERRKNTDSMEEYQKGHFEDLSCREELSENGILEETMFLGLRRMEGVLLTEQVQNVYREVLERMRKMRLLEIAGDRVRLTEKGIDVSNRVLAEFLLDED